MDRFEMSIETSQATRGLGHYPLKPPISMGTTLVACEFDSGVVVGTDSRTSVGYGDLLLFGLFWYGSLYGRCVDFRTFISSRCTNKIIPVTDHIVVCCSGSAADSQAITDVVKHQVEAHSLHERESLSVYRVAQVFRRHLYENRDKINASVLVAGWDAIYGGQIFSLPHGGFISRQQFTWSGSGSTFAMGYMDHEWRPEMSLDETKKMVKTAVALAMGRDGSSGGVIRLAVVDEKGTRTELIRPDGGKYPSVKEPRAYPHFPPHVA